MIWKSVEPRMTTELPVQMTRTRENIADKTYSIHSSETHKPLEADVLEDPGRGKRSLLGGKVRGVLTRQCKRRRRRRRRRRR